MRHLPEYEIFTTTEGKQYFQWYHPGPDLKKHFKCDNILVEFCENDSPESIKDKVRLAIKDLK